MKKGVLCIFGQQLHTSKQDGSRLQRNFTFLNFTSKKHP